MINKLESIYRLKPGFSRSPRDQDTARTASSLPWRAWPGSLHPASFSSDVLVFLHPDHLCKETRPMTTWVPRSHNKPAERQRWKPSEQTNTAVYQWGAWSTFSVAAWFLSGLCQSSSSSSSAFSLFPLKSRPDKVWCHDKYLLSRYHLVQFSGTLTCFSASLLVLRLLLGCWSLSAAASASGLLEVFFRSRFTGNKRKTVKQPNLNLTDFYLLLKGLNRKCSF